MIKSYKIFNVENNVKEYKFLYYFLVLESFLLGPVRVIGTFDVVQKIIY